MGNHRRLLPGLARPPHQIVRAGPAIDIAHKLQTQYAGHIVVARFDISHGRQQSHRARSAGGFVARCRDARQLRVMLAKKAAQQALPRKQVRDKVADVTDFYLAWLDSGIFDCPGEYLPEHLIDTQ